jgi:RNA polymerase sigma-70 factor, ECF subfamily
MPRHMPGSGQQDITAMLAAWKGGDAASLDRLMEAVYPLMRRIARRQLQRRRGGESLESAGLANETYLKLARTGGIGCEHRVHFLALCAQMMRRILVDHARRRRAGKRAGDVVPVALDELPAAAAHAVDILALDEALQRLADMDPRKSRVVELRHFGGLTIEETAEVLGVSIDTAKRDWRMARAWLLTQLASQ